MITQNSLRKWIWTALVGALAVTCALAGFALARGFGGNGKKVLKVGPSSGPRLAVPYPGGRILLGGVFYGRNGLMRLRSNGVRDRSFGRDGYAAVPALFNVADAAVQPDGKIVLVGDSPVPKVGNQFVVVRLLSSGGMDQSFGSEGVRVVEFGQPHPAWAVPYDFASTVAVQRDGRIVVGGFSGLYGGRDLRGDPVIVRLQSDGELDRSFSGGGWRRVPVENIYGYAHAVDLALTRAGIAVAIRDFYLKVTRIHYSGRMDRSFGRQGRVTIDAREFGHRLGDIFYPIDQIGLASGDRIVIAGTAWRFCDECKPQRFIGALRYLRNGKLDRSFGRGGLARVGFRNFVGAFAFRVQPNGRLFVAGNAYTPKRVYAAAVLRPDGRGLDRRFGNGGKVKFGFVRRNWADRVRGMILQRRGRVIIVGYTVERDGQPPYPKLTALARFGPHRVR